MTSSKLHRILGAGGAIALAAGMAATLGMGAAQAESISSDEIDASSITFTRTVAGDAVVNGEVTTGDEIQITNTINRKLLWLVYSAQDNHPTCIEAVPNTSAWTVGGKTYSNSGDTEDGTIQKPDEVTTGEGWAKIDAAGISSWEATPLTWTQTYTVNCDPGTLNTGGLQSDSTGGKDNKADVGPTITVKAKPVIPGPGGGDGAGSLGSLFSIFGSLS
ncbi:hypothetical protein [Tomitella biformata]|uniref:hypothetical protein n=1 Tax=Tomitella biformata TaxID=630403 RepID=UPI0004646498|nr:hypothetical protein [Tomitella biformata]